MPINKKILITFFLLSIFFAAFLPVKDTDFGWHYRCGKEIWYNPKICLANNFSYFLENYQSYNPHFFMVFYLLLSLIILVF